MMRFPALTARLLALVRPYLTDAGKTAVRNLFWLSIFTALTQACSLVLVFILTRGLSKDDFGILAFALTLQSYFLIVGSAGLPSVVIREGTQHPDQLDAIATSYLVISAGFSTILCLVVVAGTFLAPISSDERTLLCLVAVANIAASVSPRPFFDIHHEQAKSGFIMLTVEILTLSGFIALYRNGALTIRTVGFMFAGKWLVLSLLHFLSYHRFIRPIRLAFSRTNTLHILRSSWVLMLGMLVYTIPLNSGVLFVRIFNGEGDAAILGIATQVTNAFFMFAMLGNQIVQPHVVGQYGLQRSFVKKLILFCVAFYTLLGCAFAIAGTLAIRLFLDDRYQPAILPMLILLAGAVLCCLHGIPGMYLIRARAENLIVTLTASMGVAFIAGCILVVPYLSYLGAALVLASVGLLALPVWILIARRRVTFQPD